MVLWKEIIRKRIVPFLALISSCAPYNQQLQSEATSNKIDAAAVSSTPYEFHFTPFAKYNPPLTATPIALHRTLKQYLMNGLDFDDFDAEEDLKIKEYLQFENRIYEQARKLDCTEERIKMLTPREAAQLTCDIVAQQMNYLGSFHDFRIKQQKAQTLKRWKVQLEEVVNKKDVAEEWKKDAQQGLTALQEIEQLLQKQYASEEKAAKTTSYAALRYDSLPVDTLLGQGEGVCRQFAAVANGVFYVLKRKNPLLQNTYVAAYSARNHRWNQIATLTNEGNKIHVHFSFFDPTFYDVMGDSEGYDHFHFPYLIMLGKQVQTLEQKLQGTTTRPSQAEGTQSL